MAYVSAKPEVSAARAGLHYATDAKPGYGRRGSARNGFHYVDTRGRRITSAATLARIRALAIPPAWTEVWISPRTDGHIQATGFDAKGRKQYRYHPEWTRVRGESKFNRMIAFGKALPALRRRIARDMAAARSPREQLLATIVRLLETTLIRVGNEEYARANRSFGLTTLRSRHVQVRGSAVQFKFRGKSGVDHAIKLTDRTIAAAIRRLQELPGQELFQYADESGTLRPITSCEVNAYLQDITGEAFTAKDFRTWAATVLAAKTLREFSRFDSQAQAKQNVMAAIEGVAKKLGNTKSVCRKCYVHPEVIEAYLDGQLIDTIEQRAQSLRRAPSMLQPEEAFCLDLLMRRLRAESKKSG
jgi:DNA topoisomerase-1